MFVAVIVLVMAGSTNEPLPQLATTLIAASALITERQNPGTGFEILSDSKYSLSLEPGVCTISGYVWKGKPKDQEKRKFCW